MPNAMNINDPAELAAEYKRFYEMRNSKKNNNTCKFIYEISTKPIKLINYSS